MLAEDCTEFVRKVPFRPYRIVTSDGQRYEIRHTDYALVLDDSVVVYLSEKGQDRWYSERSILCCPSRT